MFEKWLYSILVCSVFLFSNCTNELDITAPYKDTTIVYGFLSPTDSVQYVKIYKAFVGEGNAFQSAQQADSFYFADVLDVKLLRIKQGSATDTINMKRDTLQNMTDGIFASVPNVVYTTTAAIDLLYTYQLIIHNLKTGSTVRASTVIPAKAVLLEPSQQSDEISLASQQYVINWQSGLHAKVYAAVIRFHYEEITSGISVAKFIDWSLGTKIVKDAAQPEYLDFLKSKDAFYKNLEAKLSIPDSQTYRIAGKIELIFTGGADDYYYYQHINNLTVGVNQSIPAFTNIQNGLGIFSAKHISKWLFDLDNASYDYLRHSVYTSKLKFY